ncbi:hypothetical protein SAMN05444285_101270 [Draconibacterium orientale]|uniref:Uncharacterized protein n=1 Tax=Draconibacterium orientale TaxID=1168034 RepID=A0A1H9YR03_9BACT|nr:hypothetical protein SAMN05444285_101270 [Draconibacterium orientale]
MTDTIKDITLNSFQSLYLVINTKTDAETSSA